MAPHQPPNLEQPFNPPNHPTLVSFPPKDKTLEMQRVKAYFGELFKLIFGNLIFWEENFIRLIFS